ncbi:hypothetical protein [Amycolatopsis aidingensis]|uniref:hypothetical protein n=1 Tax=Amycolatopsis aidingensis TaxID=2842453 RepID=UPI001C0D5435|nr:hypothetical protein [Amycolatopsis aidingensis]
MTEETAAARLAEEIRLLVELVVERAAPWLDGLVAAGHGAEDGAHRQSAAEEEPAGTSACGWCPLCAVVAVARGERPEFAARLLDQATQLVALLRAVLADRWEPEQGVHMPGFRPQADAEPEPAAYGSGRRVQRIAVRRREDWDAVRPAEER